MVIAAGFVTLAVMIFQQFTKRKGIIGRALDIRREADETANRRLILIMDRKVDDLHEEFERIMRELDTLRQLRKKNPTQSN